MTGLLELADCLAHAETYLDVFEDQATLKDEYRRLARIVHPDTAPSEARVSATNAFQRLNTLYTDAEQMVAEGRFGERVLLATITTRRGRHEVRRKIGLTDLATLYDTTTAGEKTLLKVTRSPKDNDLMAAEATALKKLNGDEPWSRAYPVLVDSFMYQRHRANVLATQAYESYTLDELTRIFRGGLDSRHVAWIWRKLLMAMGYAHDQEIIHGAVLPPHILILPAVHGVMLTDWYYSVGDQPIKALVDRYRTWYPEEVLAKGSPSAATDIYMAAGCMGDLLTANAPKSFRAFFNGCMLTKQSMRPRDPWVLLREFDELLERMGVPHYPRRFVELTVPTGAA